MSEAKWYILHTYSGYENKVANDIKTLAENRNLQNVIEDIENEKVQNFQNTICLHEDAKMINENDLVDCVITSPPYLNGTNYIRNTKLELKLTDYILSEKDINKIKMFLETE